MGVHMAMSRIQGFSSRASRVGRRATGKPCGREGVITKPTKSTSHVRSQRWAAILASCAPTLLLQPHCVALLDSRWPLRQVFVGNLSWDVDWKLLVPT